MKQSAYSNSKVGVVGGGLGGLAAACVLAARGYRVVVFEASSWAGGKAAVLQKDGFRFDMGPTILTLPSVLGRIFAEAGRNLADYLELVNLDPQWRSFFEDGTTLDLVSDLKQMTSRLDQFSGGKQTGEGYARFLQRSEKLHDISKRYFFYKPIGGISDMFDFKGSLNASTLSDVLTIGMGRSVAGVVRGNIPDARVAQMVDHFTQYVGSAPDQSPAVLCGIAHMQTQEGVWYPKGGTGAVPRALVRLAQELGVEIRLNSRVTQVITHEGRATGVQLITGEQHGLAAVVCNSDTVRTHLELVKGDATDDFLKRRKYEAACSGVVLYLGLKKRYDHLLHHNFVFSKSPEHEFHQIYREGVPAEDMTAYLCAPSQTEPGVAPEGGEALYVLVHAPYLRPGQDWKAMLPGYRNQIIEKLKRCAGMPDLEERIVYESALTPQDIQDRYRVLNGAIYGLASHGRFLGAFKPSNRSPDIRGLYFGGGSAHPGPGMPMVMMSGWIAADALDMDQIAPRQSSQDEVAPRSMVTA